ncbi:uncharacterized protein LOC119405746 [Rhipicephalus sanguineus]|uniref:uncharacterized protein LOC119405746 n=1 Tax=Rhipicephalus sanguineus TaxID=34632 RepID=UPI0020C44C07|nr:uncharacterized protein LOC119405746 [Rhipicephalus sanguineus]
MRAAFHARRRNFGYEETPPVRMRGKESQRGVVSECISLFFLGRRTKFKESVLNEIDANNDPIHLWCKSGVKDTEALCVVCNCTIDCSQQGIAAVKRHATMKKHIHATAKNRDKNGNLQPPKLVQAALNFSPGASSTSLQDKVLKAEAMFAMSITTKCIPFSWGDTATDIYHRMFPDSSVAKGFRCGRSKLSRIVSDGLGPYFKSKVVDELCHPGVFYSIMVDETPKPDQRVQQLDVLVRFFSEAEQHVVVEHVQSYNLGRATAEIIVGCVEDALVQLPRQGIICFFSDGPNVMKSVRRKLEQHMTSSIADVGHCSLHKVHNAFAKGLDAFGSDVEEVVRNVYYYFKSAVRSDIFRESQNVLGIPSHVFLRHVSNRWLTLQESLCRILEQFDAIKNYFEKAKKTGQRSATQSLHNKLAVAFSQKPLYAKVLFLKNCAELFTGFQKLFQKKEPLLTILHAELLSLVRRVLSRVLRNEAYQGKTVDDLKSLNLQDSTLWKTKPELGMDTDNAMRIWDIPEKKRLWLGARAFYIACSQDLLQKLPLGNKLLQHARILGLHFTDADSEARSRLLEGRASLSLHSLTGLRQVKTYLQRYSGDATKVPLSPKLLRCVKKARTCYAERLGKESEDSEVTKRATTQTQPNAITVERLKKDLNEKVESCRALLKRAEETISTGLAHKSMEQVQIGQLLLAEGNESLAAALLELDELEKKSSKSH